MFQKLLFLICVLVVVKSDECSNDNIKCYENELVSYIDSLDYGTTIGDFVVLEKVRDIPRQENHTENVFERTLRYLEEHQLKLKISGSRGGRSMSGSYKSLLYINH